MTTFTDLGLDTALLKALGEEGYTIPTPIQAKAVPGVMEGRDLLGIAQTGTGKTAAFALPILHRLNASRRKSPRRGARAVILSPTRELAMQIGDSFKAYGRHLGFSVAVIFGGVPHKPQRVALSRGLDILVATPGRLIDHIDENNADLGSTEILVLDEADQMLDMGFIRPIRQILSKLPARRQNLFFSATMPREIGALAGEMLRDPLHVSVTPVAKTADRVAQKVIFIEAARKKALLADLFGDPAMSRTLVFTRTKRGADRLARYLSEGGIGVAAIHGNKSQGQRTAALKDFKSGKLRGLVATDIAARGIDIDLVTHVVNFELPNIPESYVHRIGRTARAGAEGIAISFCDGEERAYLRDIQRLTRQQIPSEDRRGDVSLAAEARVTAPAKDGRVTAQDRRQEKRPGSASQPHRGKPKRNGQRWASAAPSERDAGARGKTWMGDKAVSRDKTESRDRTRVAPHGDTRGDGAPGQVGAGAQANTQTHTHPQKQSGPKRKNWQNRKRRGHGSHAHHPHADGPSGTPHEPKAARAHRGGRGGDRAASGDARRTSGGNSRSWPRRKAAPNAP